MEEDKALRDANVRLFLKGVQAETTKEQAKATAGWSVIIVAKTRDGGRIKSIGDVLYGEQILDPEHEKYINTEEYTVPQAEITAMHEALQWVAHYRPTSAHVESTAKYIVGAMNEVNKQKKNRAAINKVDSLLKKIQKRGINVTITWTENNNRVTDILQQELKQYAQYGAQGKIRWLSTVRESYIENHESKEDSIEISMEESKKIILEFPLEMRRGER